MAKISQIKERLTSSDKRTIAEWVGCSKTFVQLVIDGQRNSETDKGRLIIECAIALVSAREGIKQLIETNGNAFRPSKKTYWMRIESNY